MTIVELFASHVPRRMQILGTGDGLEGHFQAVFLNCSTNVKQFFFINWRCHMPISGPRPSQKLSLQLSVLRSSRTTPSVRPSVRPSLRPSVRPPGHCTDNNLCDFLIFIFSKLQEDYEAGLCKSSVRKAATRASEMVWGPRSTDGTPNL